MKKITIRKNYYFDLVEILNDNKLGKSISINILLSK